MMKYLTIAVLSLAILVGSHQISRVECDGSWVYMYNESGKKYQTLSANSVGDVIGVAGNTFTPPQRQLDLYLGQKRQETQHPFRPIIGKRLRGYRITNFERRNPSPEKLLMNERPVPANGSSMKMALTLLLKATNNFTEVFSYGLSRSLSHILSMENLSMAQENVLGIYLTV